MTKVEDMSKKLAEKGTWVVKGFQDILNMWAKATNTDLHNGLVTRMFVGEIENNDYYLKRGVSTLLKYNRNPDGDTDFQSENEIDINTLDMNRIRSIILELPFLFGVYAKKLEKEIKYMDDCKRIFDRYL